VSSYTKAIIVNSPNNPSGIIYSEEFIRQIVEFCEQKGIYLIVDDIYHKLVFDGKIPVPAYKFTNKDVESTKLIVVNGVAKLYGMTGFRVGWVIASRKLVEIMTNVQAQTTTCVSPVMQAAAEGALTGVQSIVESLRLTIQNNRDVVMQEMKTFNSIRLTKPEGTFYCFPDFRAYSNDSVELSNILLKKALVVTVPGKEFGMEGFLRLSYSGSVKDVTEGIARIKWALDPTSPNEIYIGDRKMLRDWL
jgi:aspartate aminotransferase